MLSGLRMRLFVRVPVCISCRYGWMFALTMFMLRMRGEMENTSLMTRRRRRSDMLYMLVRYASPSGMFVKMVFAVCMSGGGRMSEKEASVSVVNGVQFSFL